MATYVEIPAETIESFLQDKGFLKTTVGNEVVYFRNHHIWNAVKVMVYTSIRVGNTTVRGKGKDSIKVCLVYKSHKKEFGIGKATPVFRVGKIEDVLDRMLTRMRECYSKGTEWINLKQCKRVLDT